MRITQILYSILVSVGVCFLVSCSEDDDVGHINSDVRLLPEEIITEYGASTRRIYTYGYDDNNRLIEYKETKYYGNDIAMEDMETTCRIIYNSENEIDSLIISPRFLDMDSNLIKSMIGSANDTILFEHQGNMVLVKRKGSADEIVLVNAKGQVLTHNYFREEGENNSRTTVEYEYDNNGNILKHTTNLGTSSGTPYLYAYDKKNGVFKNVNTPQWFLAIMLNQDFYFINNYKEYTDDDGYKWQLLSEYNKDDYPSFFRIKYDGKSYINANNAPTSISYTRAR